jgi:hypothetical protein
VPTYFEQDIKPFPKLGTRAADRSRTWVPDPAYGDALARNDPRRRSDRRRSSFRRASKKEAMKRSVWCYSFTQALGPALPGSPLFPTPLSSLWWF